MVEIWKIVLGCASDDESIQKVQDALDRGQGINAYGSDVDDNWAMIIACEKGFTKTIRLLIDYGADIADNCHYAIQWASRNGHTNTVQLLIDYGADIAAMDNWAVGVASDRGHMDTVRLLIENGADVTGDDNYAVRNAIQNGNIEIVELLLENGARLSLISCRKVSNDQSHH